MNGAHHYRWADFGYCAVDWLLHVDSSWLVMSTRATHKDWLHWLCLEIEHLAVTGSLRGGREDLLSRVPKATEKKRDVYCHGVLLLLLHYWGKLETISTIIVSILRRRIFTSIWLLKIIRLRYWEEECYCHRLYCNRLYCSRLYCNTESSRCWRRDVYMHMPRAM